MSDIINEESILYFYGDISQEILTSLVEELFAKLEKNGVSFSINKRVSIIIIEQLQNIMKYSRSDAQINDELVPHALFQVLYSKKEDKYTLIFENEISVKDILKLEKKIEYLNSLTKEELKKYLKQKLRNEEDKHEKGAGLGLIEIARNANDKIEYSFKTVDERTFFQMKVYI